MAPNILSYLAFEQSSTDLIFKRSNGRRAVLSDPPLMLIKPAKQPSSSNEFQNPILTIRQKYHHQPWTEASAGMTVRRLAYPQLPQKLRAMTKKRFRDLIACSSLVISSSNSFPNLSAGNDRSSSFLTASRVCLAAVAASYHGSILLAR